MMHQKPYSILGSGSLSVFLLLMLLMLSPMEFFEDSIIPISLQSLLVLLCGALVGPWRGFLLVLAYLLVGGAGLPVFAGGSSGWEKFIGSTAGFLLGFPIAAFLVGWIRRAYFRNAKNQQMPWLTNCGLMLFGHAIILSLGFVYLAKTQPELNLFGLMKDLSLGLFAKSIFGATVLSLVDRFSPFSFFQI